MDKTIRTRFEGGWCDNCRQTFPFIPANGNCPECKTLRLHKATITVDVHEEVEKD